MWPAAFAPAILTLTVAYCALDQTKLSYLRCYCWVDFVTARRKVTNKVYPSSLERSSWLTKDICFLEKQKWLLCDCPRVSHRPTVHLSSPASSPPIPSGSTMNSPIVKRTSNDFDTWDICVFFFVLPLNDFFVKLHLFLYKQVKTIDL